jgi:hypothetical protein
LLDEIGEDAKRPDTVNILTRLASRLISVKSFVRKPPLATEPFR